MTNIINFIKSGFNMNLGYTVNERIYTYNSKPHLGYVVVKNYIIFWITGYTRIGLFVDRKAMKEYLELNSIKINK